MPNAISVLRIVLVVPVALAIVAGNFRLALVLAVLAGVSDGVDGWLARHFGWRSHLGGVLDPVADKLLLVTCFVVLAWVGEASVELTILVLARDLVIALGALAWYGVIGRFRARPSWISKCCTTVQILYVLAVLTTRSGWLDGMPLTPWTWLVVIFTVASGLDYIVRWGWLARRQLIARKCKEGEHES
ncbi:MAG TPA: CDP-alcohol phosphatidyltransferase family protein [Oleiagrimonas sp.]|nr:CDP-alcohol phosphatidyltransferase family protein [Oleiagrimonas sp.]